MITTTGQLIEAWAALENNVPHTLDQSGDWLASLKVVMAALERTLQNEGRGAFILLITPFGGLPRPPVEAASPAPPQKEKPNPPAG